jgi:hypothetical protein
MVMRVVKTVRRDKVKRVISSVMYRNVERDRGKKVRRINSAIKKIGDKG